MSCLGVLQVRACGAKHLGNVDNWRFMETQLFARGKYHQALLGLVTRISQHLPWKVVGVFYPERDTMIWGA